MRLKDSAARQVSPEVKGYYRTHGRLIRGWVLDRADLDRKLEVEIFVDGRRVGSARADRYDASVEAQYGGDGVHGFAFYVADDFDRRDTIGTLVKEVSSGKELRSKDSLIDASAASLSELQIDKLAATQIVGRASGYPAIDSTALELWSSDNRVLSQISLRWDDNSEASFSADLPRAAIVWLLSEGTRVALPGLKEGGLSASAALDVKAVVTRMSDHLVIELSHEFELCHPVELLIQFAHDSSTTETKSVLDSSGKATCRWPSSVPASAAVQVSIFGRPVNTVFTREVKLSDPNFSTLSDNDRHVWQIAAGCCGERAFYAFPNEIASELGLSGHFAHVWGQSGTQRIGISQLLTERFAVRDRLTKRVLLRSRIGTRLTLRLTDDAGVLAEVSGSARGEQRWTGITLDVELSRTVEGLLRFEIESESPEGDELDIALVNSADDQRSEHHEETANLLVNDGFVDWPFGAAVLSHAVRGDICAGWRLFNRKCRTPVFSRPTWDSAADAIGLAIAAPEITNYLRLEADLVGADVETHDTVLTFTAFVSSAARRLMSQSAYPIPAFTVFERIYLLRRTRTLVDGEVSENDEILSPIARKIAIDGHIGRHRFDIPRCARPDADDEPFQWATTDQPAQRTYHVVFEFRSPAVIELSCVRVTISGAESACEPESLQLEDRNILLQIPLLKTLEHWRSRSPNLPANRSPSTAAGLKWSMETSREAVEIVIPVHNALDETMECLASLSRSTSVPILVRIIDDASDAAVSDALDAYASDKPWVRVHHFETNRGYTFAADFGIRATQSEWVVLLNSDTVTTEAWLERMLSCARSNPKVAFVGPLSNAATYQSVPDVHDAAGKFKVNALPAGAGPDFIGKIVSRISRRDYPEAPLLNGFCTLMKRSVFLEIGGLNHGAFPSGYGEENDLCIRATKAGWQLAIADDVYVFHHKSASFGNSRRTELSKVGSQTLKKLHPDVDINALTSSFKEIPALNFVRAALARELKRGTLSEIDVATSLTPSQSSTQVSRDLIS